MNPYSFILRSYVDVQSGPVSSLVQAVLQLGEALNLTTSENPAAYVRQHLRGLGVNSFAVQHVANVLAHAEERWARGER